MLIRFNILDNMNMEKENEGTKNERFVSRSIRTYHPLTEII